MPTSTATPKESHSTDSGTITRWLHEDKKDEPWTPFRLSGSSQAGQPTGTGQERSSSGPSSSTGAEHGSQYSQK
ncbi:Uu.00g096680.m01.CDS01 [Anthostomella pinea]|uniref:Uu.00g096680.m01.CDS01 n=1 Tax=Anthostomella pinea TaxID=933095 RepID=A0AAI8YCK0_9PEZI|nr:Uu.00g096680.m01.CDS01 [Anthostomella pinea]